MKKLILIIALFLLTGCENSYHAVVYPVMPTELSDCKVFRLNNNEGESIVIARCPNSTTTTSYKSGKSTHNVVVIDGVKYISKD